MHSRMAPPPINGLPPIDQIGVVVRDMEAALSWYQPLFGPFSVLDNGPFDAVYRGRPARAHLIVAFGRSGGLEIELVQWIAGATPHRDFLLSGREGLQHVRFPVSELDPWVRRAAPLGYEPVWAGTYAAHGISWCYLERAGDPLIIEFVSWSATSGRGP
jgi:methylmalonyl-CoA/ethylmalonyl-CoA epimerase